MADEKIRIYELAKKLDIPNKQVITLLAQKLNIEAKSHTSSVSVDNAQKLAKILKDEKKETEKPSKVAETKPAPKEVKEIKEVKETKETKPETEKRPAPPEKLQNFQKARMEARKTQETTERDHVSRESQQGTGFRPHGGPRPYQQREGQRPYQPREGQGQRPYQQRDGQGQRPYQPREGQGQRPYQSREGQRPYQPREGQGQRPYQSREGQRPYQPREGQGQRPYQSREGQGQRPYPPRDGARPYQPREGQGQRPQGEGFRQGPRREGQQGTGFRPHGGPRPFQPREGQGQRPQGEGFKPAFGEAGKKPVKRRIIDQGAFGASKSGYSARKAKPKSSGEKFERANLEKNIQQHYKKKPKKEHEQEKITQIVITGPLTVGELSTKMGISSAEIVKSLMMKGILATVNQTIEEEQAIGVAKEFEMEVLTEEPEAKESQIQEEVIDESKLVARAPVVTIMGHVDHGKTTLLDAIRASKHKIVNTEVGGITQSIGAYTVKINNKKIVFIDTPGHEAFTAMRARGAQSTDIAVLVVAADDGIMPQTIEAINHAKAAKVPIIVAVNKMDKPGADPDKILQQLTEYGLVPEDWGGETICVKVSALLGTNLDELLEYINLMAEILELKANPEAKATGVVIEANLDKGKGPVATLLVQNGTIKVGDCVAIGTVGGKVRALLSDNGARIKKAGPSTPVEILGLDEVPQSGDKFEVMEDEKTLRSIVEERKEHERTSKLEAIASSQPKKGMSIDGEEVKELNVIIKASTHGSAEAVSASLQQITSETVVINIIHIGVGDISEADVMLASASDATIIGFDVKEDQNASRIAANENVHIKKYDIIYQILEDAEKTMLGLLKPEEKEVDLGQAEVRQVFTVGKTSKIAGCYVTEGKIARNKTAVVLRDGKEIFKGQIDQLKRFKDDVKEVATGFECGISFNKFNDIKEGDIIKVTTTEIIERETLV